MEQKCQKDDKKWCHWHIQGIAEGQLRSPKITVFKPLSLWQKDNAGGGSVDHRIVSVINKDVIDSCWDLSL